MNGHKFKNCNREKWVLIVLEGFYTKVIKKWTNIRSMILEKHFRDVVVHMWQKLKLKIITNIAFFAHFTIIIVKGLS